MRKLLVCLLFLTGTARVALVTPFISEIHCANTGADIDELVEITGSRVDLSGWVLRFYNGATGAIYDSMSLTGMLAGEALSSLAFFPGFSLQNGSPDGLAMIAAGGDVVEFLSYEGSFTASDGEAAGLTSTVLPVRETGSTPVGHALQRLSLDGTGWEVGEATPGVVNTGPLPLPPTLGLLFAGLWGISRA
jgi:hypothetical protein